MRQQQQQNIPLLCSLLSLSPPPFRKTRTKLAKAKNENCKKHELYTNAVALLLCSLLSALPLPPLNQVRARTGSGKTAAFALPLLQKILRRKAAEPGLARGVRAVVLVPTRELCEQVRQQGRGIGSITGGLAGSLLCLVFRSSLLLT